MGTSLTAHSPPGTARATRGSPTTAGGDAFGCSRVTAHWGLLTARRLGVAGTGIGLEPRLGTCAMPIFPSLSPNNCCNPRHHNCVQDKEKGGHGMCHLHLFFFPESQNSTPKCHGSLLLTSCQSEMEIGKIEEVGKHRLPQNPAKFLATGKSVVQRAACPATQTRGPAHGACWFTGRLAC